MSFVSRVAERAAFAPGTMQKVTCFDGARLLLGLNCFEPGQTQAIHVHAGADKFYLVLSGKASFHVGDETREAAAGDLVVAPAGVSHGVVEVGERTVVLVGMTKGR